MIDTKEEYDSSIVGIWAPVSGNAAETVEYRADGTVKMAILGGAYHMEGKYRFIDPTIIEIEWGVAPSEQAEKVVGTVNDRLTESGAGAQLGIVTKSVLLVAATEEELATLHLGKGRIGHFRRVS